MSDSQRPAQPTGIVIVAGDRGANAYVPLLLEEPELGRIVAVAEQNPDRRQELAADRSAQEGPVVNWNP